MGEVEAVLLNPLAHASPGDPGHPKLSTCPGCDTALTVPTFATARGMRGVMCRLHLFCVFGAGCETEADANTLAGEVPRDVPVAEWMDARLRERQGVVLGHPINFMPHVNATIAAMRRSR